MRDNAMGLRLIRNTFMTNTPKIQIVTQRICGLNSHWFMAQRVRRGTHGSATVTQVSSQLEVHQYHPYTKDSGEPRPTLVFLPWMTANQSRADRYRQLYAARGFNVVTVWSKLSYFLWPQWAMPVATEVADYLATQTRGPLLVHGMSVGAYLYAVMLSVIADNQERYAGLTSRVRGHVFDSIVIGSLDEMAKGVAKIVSPTNTLFQGAVTNLSMAYFAATKQHTVVPYKRFVDIVHDSPFKTPMLCFYSLNDVLCRPDAMEALIEHWKTKHDLEVVYKAWAKSPHAGHFKADPETYSRFLDAYLKKIGLSEWSAPPISKL